jgi:signal transduction histidine kinase
MTRRTPRDASAPSSGIGRGWIAGAALVVVLGIVASMFAAHAVARNDEQKSDRASAARSADIVARLRLAIEHERDLVVSTSAFIATNPLLSNASLNTFLRADRAFARYPEITGVARLVVVTPAQLPAFAARAVKDPTGPLAPDGSFQVIPPGTRPFYCLIDVSGSQSHVNPAPAGVDTCAVPGAAATLLSARDTGEGTYQPFPIGKQTMLGIQTPIYRGGGIPASVAERRTAFIGLVGVVLNPTVVMNVALAGHPGTAVTLAYASDTSAATFSAGKAPRDAETLTTDLHNGWTVGTSAVATSVDTLSDRNALSILIGGSAVSLLLGLLGLVLATGRARAIRQVHEQTVELRDQAEELRATVSELEAAQAVKDEFLSLVSHELRTPLTSICGYTELLKEEQLPDDQRDYLNVIDRNSARLLGLVEDLLVMAQIQSGGLPLELGEVILNDLIARSGEAARPFAASKEIALEIDAEPDIAAEGDAVRLSQVIDNLVSNAIKYTPNGGGVSITMTRSNETATIAVSDTGIGIPTDEQDQVFGRFFRTTNARVSGIEGTGLGLAITRGIVEAHGGTISFDSIEGAGSTFRITLPHAHGAGLESAA